MVKPVIKCPCCGSENTREYFTGIKIPNTDCLAFHAFDDKHNEYMREEFGDKKDFYDYYCSKNVCDDCNCHFYAKNYVKIEVLSSEVFWV